MRRKRRTKYTWLPNFGTGTPVGGNNYEGNMRFGQLLVKRDAAPYVGIIAVLPDAPPENFDGSSTNLSNAINSEYVLRRIVGKLFVTYRQSNEDWTLGSVAPIPQGAIVTAGFFVARASDVSQADPEAYPVGFVDGNSVADFNNYSPQARDTVREPWIWRRTWLLGNNMDKSLTDPTLVGQNPGYAAFPSCNMKYGSVADGPHIDAKTIRRVGNDERLFFAMATQSINATSTPPDNGAIDYVLDVRYLGALRRPRQRGAF